MCVYVKYYDNNNVLVRTRVRVFYLCIYIMYENETVSGLYGVSRVPFHKSPVGHSRTRPHDPSPNDAVVLYVYIAFDEKA